MYQLEVKRWLVAHLFSPSNGWDVFVDIDAMERIYGGPDDSERAERVAIAEAALKKMGVVIGRHPEYGRVDVLAKHHQHGTFIVEVEGKSKRQREQAMYSAIGQLVLQMKGEKLKFAIAVPDDESWKLQLRKIPDHVKKTLNLSCWLVSDIGVQTV